MVRKLGVKVYIDGANMFYTQKKLGWFVDWEDEVTGKVVPKANFDVEITRDILYEILFFKASLDAFVFLSGDSDFAPLAWDLKKKFKKKIFIFSSRRTLSWEMRVAASGYFYLDRLKKELFRKNWGLTKVKKCGKSKLSCRRSR